MSGLGAVDWNDGDDGAFSNNRIDQPKFPIILHRTLFFIGYKTLHCP